MTMRSITAKLFGAALVAGSLALPASATPIQSGSGSATCELNAAIFGSSACTLQTITAHNAWQQAGSGHLAGSGAQWVSYANTGVSGGNLLAPVPQNTSATPNVLSSVPWLMKVTETFSVGDDGSIFMQVWADDTADVYLNNVLKKAANYSQGTCAGGSIGCEPHEFFLLDEGLTAGTYTLDFYLYQLGSDLNPSANPFGLIYSGDIGGVTTTQVPAPAGLCLLGLGLLGVGALRRRR